MQIKANETVSADINIEKPNLITENDKRIYRSKVKSSQN